MSRLSGLSLDFKLAARMLVKYPGLTIIGGLAMAFAIWAGSVSFELLAMMLDPSLPLPRGDRIVQLRNWDASANAQEKRALHDFAQWRTQLRSVTDVGAYRDVRRNLRGSDGEMRPVDLAEISASGFRVASGQPLMGRVLLPSDEQPGAPPVVVLGHDIWQTRFGGAATIVGQSVQVDDAFPTVVGVMPAGFEFPIAHDLWMPLPADLLGAQPREGPAITVFGRLAPDVSLDEAQAELTTLGARAAAAYPRTHEHLRPQVAAYTTVVFEPNPSDRVAVFAIYLFVIMLLVLICSNVAMLLFARAATRENELVVRSALGATRGRIVAQLFAEALVLGAVAAIVGLAAAGLVLGRWGGAFLELNMGRLPFWYDPGLSPATVVAALGLTVLAAAIAGVLPALRITRGLGGRLREATPGAGGPRFGGVWTVVIVTQVAFTVAFPVVAFVEQQELSRIRSYDPGFPAAEYLSVRLDADGMGAYAQDPDTTAAARERFAMTLEAVRQRIASDPAVAGVTFVDRLPRDYHPEYRIEVEGMSMADAASAQEPDEPPEVSMAGIDPSYFDVLGAPILAGRAFHSGDAQSGNTIIVDQGFVDVILKGRNPLGRRIRYVSYDDEPGPPPPWLEIVGVVKELGMGFAVSRQRAAGVYSAIPVERLSPLQMVVHTRGDPMAAAPRIRQLAASVDPRLRLTEVQRLDEVTSPLLWILNLWLRITAVLMAIALLLSLAGIYAVLSFTVARRTREIGIRVALGASRRGVVTAIFRRPLTQVAIGVAAGAVLIALMSLVDLGGDGGMTGGGMSPRQVVLLIGYAAFMMGVCMLACIVPTRRALGVEPGVALRAE